MTEDQGHEPVGPQEEAEPTGPVIRDKRRLDPETGTIRDATSEAGASSAPAAGGAEGQQAGESPAAATTSEEADADRPDSSLADDLKRDLQRLNAEYVNYKRRVDRDRAAVREAAAGSVLTALLPVLDDIDRAREHDELRGGFKAVADSFQRTLSGLGLERFGEPGDPFDPRIHEALSHRHDDTATGPTCQFVMQPGYRLAERILRPARVAVVEPPDEPTGDAPADDAGADASSEQPSAGTGDTDGSPTNGPTGQEN